MGDSGLYSANLAFLARRFPAIHAKVAGLNRTVSKPIFENDRAIDIDLGSKRLYNANADELCAWQVDDFVARPNRSGYRSIEGASTDSVIARRFYEGLLDCLRGKGATQFAAEPVGRSGILFVFGIGLGRHLPLLAERIDVDHIVVIEAVDEFLAASLHAIDWQQMAAGMAERKQTLHLILESDPALINDQIHLKVAEIGDLFLDGAYYYRHYPFWSLAEAYERLREKMPFFMVGRGYYEDERKMVRHAVTNLHKFGHYLVTGQCRRRYDVPAFIVAAGPSLDESIEYLRQWKDHGIIFCAGTTLQVLIKAGIIPDYHVELENVAMVYELCQHILEQRPDLYPEKRFTGMKFLGSVTVNPRVPPLFDEHYFFYRDSATSSSCFGEGIKEVDGVGPTISNTAIALAARLGFDTLYLFGVDCGWRDELNHHAKDTMYYTFEGYKREKFDGGHETAGNFGGIIQSDLGLTWTRSMIEQKIERYRLKVFNCSDGAFIRGSTPKLAESLDFPGPPLDKEVVFARIRDESQFFAAGEFLRDHDMARYGAKVERLRDDFQAFVRGAQVDKIDFHEFLLRLDDFDTEAMLGPYRQVYPWFRGTIIGFVKAATFYMNRLSDPKVLASVMAEFLCLYRDLHTEMFDEAHLIFDEAKIMVDGGPEPWWTDGLPRVPGTTY